MQNERSTKHHCKRRVKKINTQNIFLKKYHSVQRYKPYKFKDDDNIKFLITVYNSLKIRVDSKCVSLTSSKNPRASAQLCIRIYYVASVNFLYACMCKNMLHLPLWFLVVRIFFAPTYLIGSLLAIFVDVHEWTKIIWEMFYYY